MINKLSMVILMQHDLDAAVDFYLRLGCKLKFRMKGVWAAFELGTVKIGLCPTPQPIEDRRTGVVFEVTDLKKLVEDHKNELMFIGEPIEKIHGIMIGLKDPSGNILELYQPTPDKVHAYVQQVKNEEASQGCCGKKIVPTDNNCGVC